MIYNSNTQTQDKTQKVWENHPWEFFYIIYYNLFRHDNMK